MATLGNCKKRQRKTNRRKNLNISADSSPLKASDGTLYVIMKEETQKEKQLIKFLTEYKKEDGMYAGHIFAETWKEAEELAKQKGETVYGYIPPDCLDCEQELELRETI